MNEGNKRALRRIASAIVTLIAAGVVYLLRVPYPMAALIIPVVFFAYVDGFLGGAISAIITLVYAAFFFFVHTNDPAALAKIIGIIITLSVIVILVGRLKLASVRNVEGVLDKNSNFLDILSGMDVLLLVTELDTDIILFANEKMNKAHCVDYDPVGLPCWQVYHGQSARCPFCPIDQLSDNPNTPIEWDYFYEATGRWLHNRESTIEWTDGKRVRLQQGTDITERRFAEQTIKRQLEQQKLTSTISQCYVADGNLQTAMNISFGKVGAFLGSERVVLYKLDHDEGVATPYFQWCRNESIAPRPQSPNEVGNYLCTHFASTSEHMPVCGDAREIAEYAAFTDAGIVAFAAAPIMVDSALWGVLCLETCFEPRDSNNSELYLTQTLASLISGAVAREVTLSQLHYAKDRAEDSAKAKANFLANMSHEIRTPMNAIIGMTDLAKASGDPERVLYCLDQVNHAADHLLGVINDVLDMSKIDAGKLALSNTNFLLSEVIERVETVTHFPVAEKNQTLTINVADDVPPAIVSDPQRLAQVLVNLFSNAVKFTADEGKIALDIQKLSEENGICTLRFDVTDTGIGIDDATQATLFQSFQQADNSISRKFGGTGLGLSICKNIVELMGGSIAVESQLGVGSRFYFTIKAPVGSAQPQTDSDKKLDFVNGCASESDVKRLSGKRILVAEDIEINRIILNSMLEDSGLIIDCALDGAEAVSMFMADEEKYDMILMDIHMPQLDGYGATEAIRAIGTAKARSIPILAMTATVLKEDIEHCMQCGMNDHIAKPIDWQELIQKMLAHLQ